MAEYDLCGVKIECSDADFTESKARRLLKLVRKTEAESRAENPALRDWELREISAIHFSNGNWLCDMESRHRENGKRGIWSKHYFRGQL